MNQAHTTSRGYTLTPEQVTRRGSILASSAGTENRKLLSTLHNISSASRSAEVDAILDDAEKMLEANGSSTIINGRATAKQVQAYLAHSLQDTGSEMKSLDEVLIVEVPTAGFQQAVSIYIDPADSWVEVRAEGWTADGGISFEKDLGRFLITDFSSIERCVRQFVAEREGAA